MLCLLCLLCNPLPCSVTNGEGKELAKCSKGQCFGELALLKNEARCGGCCLLVEDDAYMCLLAVRKHRLSGTRSPVGSTALCLASASVPFLCVVQGRQCVCRHKCQGAGLHPRRL
jgi:hypothetical protein